LKLRQRVRVDDLQKKIKKIPPRAEATSTLILAIPLGKGQSPTPTFLQLSGVPHTISTASFDVGQLCGLKARYATGRDKLKAMECPISLQQEEAYFLKL
jgi:hypothetical protein